MNIAVIYKGQRKKQLNSIIEVKENVSYIKQKNI